MQWLDSVWFELGEITEMHLKLSSKMNVYTIFIFQSFNDYVLFLLSPDRPPSTGSGS